MSWRRRRGAKERVKQSKRWFCWMVGWMDPSPFPPAHFREESDNENIRRKKEGKREVISERAFLLMCQLTQNTPHQPNPTNPPTPQPKTTLLMLPLINHPFSFSPFLSLFSFFRERKTLLWSSKKRITYFTRQRSNLGFFSFDRFLDLWLFSATSLSCAQMIKIAQSRHGDREQKPLSRWE